MAHRAEGHRGGSSPRSSVQARSSAPAAGPKVRVTQPAPEVGEPPGQVLRSSRRSDRGRASPVRRGAPFRPRGTARPAELPPLGQAGDAGVLRGLGRGRRGSPHRDRPAGRRRPRRLRGGGAQRPAPGAPGAGRDGDDRLRHERRGDQRGAARLARGPLRGGGRVDRPRPLALHAQGRRHPADHRARAARHRAAVRRGALRGAGGAARLPHGPDAARAIARELGGLGRPASQRAARARRRGLHRGDEPHPGRADGVRRGVRADAGAGVAGLGRPALRPDAARRAARAGECGDPAAVPARRGDRAGVGGGLLHRRDDADELAPRARDRARGREGDRHRLRAAVARGGGAGEAARAGSPT